MLFDAHCHLQFKAFEKDRDEVIRRTLDGKVFCINVGTQKDTSKAAVELVEKYDGFWAAVGLHPIHTGKSFVDEAEISGESGFESRGEVFDAAFYESLAARPKVAAIGECGFDYTVFVRKRSERLQKRASAEFKSEGGLAAEIKRMKQKQAEAFRGQIRLAKKINKKLMIHCRPSFAKDSEGKLFYSDDAYLDTINLLKEEGGDLVGGNVHFFVGSIDIARKFLEMGFSFSFSGVITLTDSYDDLVKFLPLDSILIETDSPYAAPKQWRGRRNEPLYIVEAAKRIAHIRGKSFNEIAELTAQNAKKIFNLKI